MNFPNQIDLNYCNVNLNFLDFFEISYHMHPITISNSELLGYTLKIQRLSFHGNVNHRQKSHIFDKHNFQVSHFNFHYDVYNNIFHGDYNAKGISYDHLNGSYSVNYTSEVNRSIFDPAKRINEKDYEVLDAGEIKVSHREYNII
jgi:hypothetical protein